MEEYAKIPAHASLYAGQHFSDLASYLNTPFRVFILPATISPVPSSQSEHTSFKYVTVYDLNTSTDRRTRHIDKIADFEDQCEGLWNSEHGHLIFMRGYPTPEWLNAIGSRYKVDPEFYLRHMSFRLGHSDLFALPVLPSAASSTFKLRLTTIGCTQNSTNVNESQDKLDQRRQEYSQLKEGYRESLRDASSCCLGDSIVRDCSIHDAQHFSIEQDVSFYVCKTVRSWAGR